MKKFIVAALASAMFFPLPVMAEEMMSEEIIDSENFDEETAALSLEESAPVEMKETSATSINVSFVETKDNKENVKKKCTVKSNTLLEDLIANIPEKYHFLQDPESISASDKEIKVAIEANATLPSPLTFTKYCVRYTTKDNSSTQGLIFDSNDLKDGVISKDKIDAKLKEANIPYTYSSSLDTKYFEGIYYVSNGTPTPVAKRSSGNPIELVKVSDDVLADMTINLKLGSKGATVTVSLADLTVKDGKVTLTGTNLANALNAQVEKNEKLKDLITYKVESFPSITFPVYGVTGTIPLEHKDLTNAKVYAVRSNKTPVTLNIKYEGDTLFTVNNLTLGDLKVSSVKDIPYGTINEKTASVKSYIETNFNKLNYGSCNFSNDKDKFAVNLIDETSIPNGWEKNEPIEGEVSVTLKYLPEKLYEEEYTLVFENSSKPGEIVDRDTRKWKSFFKDQPVGITLSDKLWTDDVLPNGWKISAVQQAGSTQKKKKEDAEVLEAASTDTNSVQLSVFSSKEIKIYVYGGKMPSNGGGGGSSSEEPEEPTDNTPMTPEDPAAPSIPSQGSSIMYRLFNPNTNEHLYTKDPVERDNLLNSGEWNNEGHGWTAPAVSSFPVYRVFNPNSGEHHYTKDKNEYDTLVSYGWTGEGQAFFSADDLDSKVVLYRLYNPTAPEAAKHHYTMYESERDELVQGGWQFEGTAWYGLSTN